MKKSRLQLYDCDRCKFTYKKKDLRKQRGMLLCDPCFDSVLEIAPVNLKLLSPRVNSNSVAPVSTPAVFSIGTAGITSLNNSQIFLRDGVINSFVMYVVGSGTPTTITTNPQIVVGRQGTLLTLVGTSDTNYIVFAAGNGTDLHSTFYLKNNRIISFVYNATSSLWCETSRT